MEHIKIHDVDYLMYKTFPVNIAVIRGTYADESGNISFDQEPARLDMLEAAQAAHNSGGKVICQVKGIVAKGSLSAKRVWIPGAYIDAIVVDPAQMQTGEGEYNPAFSGDVHHPISQLQSIPAQRTQGRGPPGIYGAGAGCHHQSGVRYAGWCCSSRCGGGLCRQGHDDH